jgi:rRNA pseudouridine-1189 N-methylase Emg1 (Nep1/Mra1 family)
MNVAKNKIREYIKNVANVTFAFKESGQVIDIKLIMEVLGYSSLIKSI